MKLPKKWIACTILNDTNINIKIKKIKKEPNVMALEKKLKNIKGRDEYINCLDLRQVE